MKKPRTYGMRPQDTRRTSEPIAVTARITPLPAGSAESREFARLLIKTMSRRVRKEMRR